jgi:nucleoside-diphosphate-sugar epimerase
VPGSGDFAFQNVFVEDVARMFVELLDFPGSVGHAYNIAGDEIYSLNDYLCLIAKILGLEPEFVHVEQDTFDRAPFSTHQHGDVFPFNTRRTAVFSLDKIKKDMNYRSTPVAEWLAKTVQWYQQEYDGHSTGYEKREQEIEFIRTLAV